MNYLNGFLDVAAEKLIHFGVGQIQSAFQPNESGFERYRIQRLCRELGWPAPAHVEDALSLRFSAASGNRSVLVLDGDEILVLLSAASNGSIPAQQLPPEIMASLLMRHMNYSQGGLGKWGMKIGDDQICRFYLHYHALGDGLCCGALKYICDSLVREVEAFDGCSS